MNTRVSTFIYCLGTTNLEGKDAPINAMGVLSIMTPEFIPSTFSFSIIVGIQGIDIFQNHKMSIIFKDSSGEHVVEAKDIPIRVEQFGNSDSNLPENFRGLMLGMDMRNVIIKAEGVYCTEIIFDNKKLGDFEIYVRAKKRS